MRLFDGWVLLLLMIFIQNNDGGRAFGHSEVDEGHRLKPLKPTRKTSLCGDLENKEANHDGLSTVSGLTSLSQVVTRNLLMKKSGSSKEVPFHGSTTIDVHHKYTKKARQRRSRKEGTLKRVNKSHQRADEAFTEDYRVPRSHPPRNN